MGIETCKDFVVVAVVLGRSGWGWAGVCWCFETSQRHRVISGLTFLLFKKKKKKGGGGGGREIKVTL